MKKSLFIILILGLPLHLFSQEKKHFYTFNSGINYTALTIRNSGQLLSTITRAPGYRFGGYCGIAFNRKLNSKLDLSLGLEISHQSWVSTFEYTFSNHVAPNANVILSHLPVKLYFKPSMTSKARLFAGLQASVLLYEYYAESDKFTSKPYTESNIGKTNRVHIYYLFGTDYMIKDRYILEFGFAAMPMSFAESEIGPPSIDKINYFFFCLKYQMRKKNEK